MSQIRSSTSYNCKSLIIVCTGIAYTDGDTSVVWTVVTGIRNIVCTGGGTGVACTGGRATFFNLFRNNCRCQFRFSGIFFVTGTYTTLTGTWISFKSVITWSHKSLLVTGFCHPLDCHVPILVVRMRIVLLLVVVRTIVIMYLFLPCLIDSDLVDTWYSKLYEWWIIQ